MSNQFDYTRIPPLPSSVYVAPLKKPAGLGEDWLERARPVLASAEDRLLATLDEDERTALVGQLQRILFDAAPR